MWLYVFYVRMATEVSVEQSMSLSGSMFIISIPSSLASPTEDSTNYNIALFIAKTNLNRFSQG